MRQADINDRVQSTGAPRAEAAIIQRVRALSRVGGQPARMVFRMVYNRVQAVDSRHG